MFTVARFTTAGRWKQGKWTSADPTRRARVRTTEDYFAGSKAAPLASELLRGAKAAEQNVPRARVRAHAVGGSAGFSLGTESWSAASEQGCGGEGCRAAPPGPRGNFRG